MSPDDLVLCLISGGASALLALPAPGLTLADKQAVNRALLKSGANIVEMNTVRKHLSAIKGGRLAIAAQPARVLSWLISDVPNDDPGVIGSGPTVPDRTTFADAQAVLARYRIDPPAAVRTHLEKGAAGEIEETPKPGDPRLGPVAVGDDHHAGVAGAGQQRGDLARVERRAVAGHEQRAPRAAADRGGDAERRGVGLAGLGRIVDDVRARRARGGGGARLRGDDDQVVERRRRGPARRGRRRPSRRRGRRAPAAAPRRRGAAWRARTT